MFTKISSQQIFLGNYGWHTGRFHFSFADYNDPENTQFGDLIAFNDFALLPGTGFDTHSHAELEIISYCIEGQMVHEDSLGNKTILERGDMQYTCAGSGITHSEKNNSTDKPLRFLQIWIKPNTELLPPFYRFMRLIGGIASTGYCISPPDNPSKTSPGSTRTPTFLFLKLKLRCKWGSTSRPNRQVYLACLEGSFNINGVPLKTGDAIKTWGERALSLVATEDCHLVVVDMSRCS